MTRTHRFRVAQVLICIASLLFGSVAQAAGPVVPAASQNGAPSEATIIRDVMLTEEGVLQGVVVNADGVPIRDIPVTFFNNGRPTVKTFTDKAGRFTVAHLPTGIYEVATPRGAGICRLWPRHQAPPVAQPGLLLVANQSTLRGQDSFRGIFCPETLITLGIIGAAIAIPLALQSDRDSGS